jgi:hypothetical protein
VQGSRRADVHIAKAEVDINDADFCVKLRDYLTQALAGIHTSTAPIAFWLEDTTQPRHPFPWTQWDLANVEVILGPKRGKKKELELPAPEVKPEPAPIVPPTEADTKARRKREMELDAQAGGGSMVAI